MISVCHTRKINPSTNSQNMDNLMQQAKNTQRTLLVIDDANDNIQQMHEALCDTYLIKQATSSAAGLKIALSDTPPDLILVDVMMPEVDGYEICRRLKATPATQHIPVIFVTTEPNTQEEEKGFALGAVDYITKPISPPIVKARVKTHLALKDSKNTLLHHHAENLSFDYQHPGQINQLYQELHSRQDVTILAMATLAEPHEQDNVNHIRRIQTYVKTLAERLQHHPRFSAVLTQPYIALLYKSASLHDIGKIGLPEHILTKQGALSSEEFEAMKQHTTLGRNAIEQAQKQYGVEEDFLECAKEIAYSHHERWDGSGYPEGLVGNKIPISARLMALADVYDALICNKNYRPALSHNEAVDIINADDGNMFDPDVLSAFLTTEATFQAIATRFPV
jgi:putative two-component system response regulator